MNERIKELAEQAGCAWWEGRAQRDMTQCQTELGKFAELMVKKFEINKLTKEETIKKIINQKI